MMFGLKEGIVSLAMCFSFGITFLLAQCADCWLFDLPASPPSQQQVHCCTEELVP